MAMVHILSDGLCLVFAMARIPRCIHTRATGTLESQLGPRMATVPNSRHIQGGAQAGSARVMVLGLEGHRFVMRWKPNFGHLLSCSLVTCDSRHPRSAHLVLNIQLAQPQLGDQTRPHAAQGKWLKFSRFHMFPHVSTAMDDDGPEVITDLPEEEKERDDLFNVRISRWIEGQLCSGLVADVCIGEVSQERLYLIEYLDSDVEHLTESEVREGLVLWATQDVEMEPVPPQLSEVVDDESIGSLSEEEIETKLKTSKVAAGSF